MLRLIFYISVCSSYLLFQFCLGLDCYACKNVDGNNGPCIRNYLTCPETQPACFTKVQWSEHPYEINGLYENRTLFVSKACMSTDSCSSMAAKYAANCTRELYNTWTCVQCCSQDYCNYNVPTIIGDIS